MKSVEELEKLLEQAEQKLVAAEKAREEAEARAVYRKQIIDTQLLKLGEMKLLRENLEDLAASHEELRSEFFATADRMGLAMTLLEKAGLLPEFQRLYVKPEEKLKASDIAVAIDNALDTTARKQVKTS